MRTKLLLNSLLIAGFLAVMFGYPMQASAVSFTFTEKAGFLVDSSLVSSDPNPLSKNNDIKWYQNSTAADYQVAPLSGEFNTIAWGVGNNNGGLRGSDPWNDNAFPTPDNVYSALRVFGQTGTVVSDGNWVVLTKLFHKNSPIGSAYFTLTNASINGNLTIAPADSGFPDDKTSNIQFVETLNQSPCDPNGPNGAACPDYFIDVLSTFNPLFFTSGAGQYEVLFDLAPIAFAQIDFPAADLIRVWTEEGQISQVNVLMKIEQVPEPASLLLLGLGLIGLGFAKRRRKND